MLKLGRYDVYQVHHCTPEADKKALSAAVWGKIKNQPDDGASSNFKGSLTLSHFIIREKCRSVSRFIKTFIMIFYFYK